LATTALSRAGAGGFGSAHVLACVIALTFAPMIAACGESDGAAAKGGLSTVSIS
jgi:hypothetical protein